MNNYKTRFGLVAAVALAAAALTPSAARADAIFTVAGGYKADFVLTDSTHLQLTLTDTGSGQSQGATISGIDFTFSGFAITGLTSGVGNTADFNNANPYTPVASGGGYATAQDLVLADGLGGHWGVIASSSTHEHLSTLTGAKPHELLAGPNASPNGNGGISFSPYVDQTATFVFGVSGVGANPLVGPVTFDFGTNPDSTTTTGTPTPPTTGGPGIPEPASLSVLGLGAMGLLLRRRNAR